MGVGSDYFPTDVRVRESGERLGWEQMHGIARSALFAAIEYQARAGVTFATITRKTHDGGLVVVRLSGTNKSIDIFYPGSTPEVTPLKKDEQYVEVDPIPLTASMLSGWTRKSILSGIGLDSFKPTSGTVRAYGLVDDWQISKKLVNLEPAIIHASQFSGTMKRVVQAILGLGVIRDSSPSYITGTVINAPRHISVSYPTGYYATSGIYKAANQNHWLVEINSTAGIIAMPLPILTNTRRASFRTFLTRRGDVDTLRVIDEFGGLPSGETFPSTLVEINAAISTGKVIRIMTAAALAEVYNPARSTFGAGWAFSESGALAACTCKFYGGPDGTPYTGGKVYWYGEHWGLDINLSTHNVAVPANTPVGNGSATLSLKSRGQFDPVAMMDLFVPSGPNTVARSFTYPRAAALAMRQTIGIPGRPAALDTNDGMGCIVHVFYVGETIERLKWVPSKAMGRLQEVRTREVDPPPGLNNPYALAIWPPFWVGDTATGGCYSPHGFTGNNVDTRILCGAASWWRADRPDSNPHQTNPTALAGYADGEGFEVLVPHPTGAPDTQTDWADGQAQFSDGIGVGGIARGRSVQCRISAIIPPLCREGYIIVTKKQFTTAPVTNGDFEGSGIHSATHEVTCHGYFNGAGPILFAPHYLGLTPTIAGGDGNISGEPTMYAVAAISAGPQRQYAMIDGYRFEGDAAKPVIRANLPAGLGSTDPEKINWVGSV